MRRVVWLAVPPALGLVWACEPPPPTFVTSTPPPPSALTEVEPIPSAPVAPPTASSQPLGGVEKPTYRVVVRTPGDLDASGPDAPPPIALPCDYERNYRGTIDERTTFSVRLHRDASGRLTGKLRYDQGNAPIELTGEVRTDGSFRLQEKGGGTFDGRCADGSGILAGSYQTAKAFEMRPRPDGEPSLFVLHTHEVGLMTNPPGCAGAPKSDRPQSFTPKGAAEPLLCFPRDPKERLKPHDDFAGPNGTCALSGRSLQVFGGASADADRLTNAALGPSGRPWFRDDIRKSVKACPYDAASGGFAAGGGYEIAFADKDVLSVLLQGSVFEYRTTPFAPETVTIDVRTGKRLALADVITDEAKFQAEMRTCMPLYRALIPNVFQPVDDFGTYLGWTKGQTPRWVIVPGGIALLGFYEAKVEEALSGTGPVVPWSVLARDGLLVPGSSVARLWDGVTPAAPKAPVCEQVYTRASLVAPVSAPKLEHFPWS